MYCGITNSYLLNSNVTNERNGEEIDFSSHSKLFNTCNVRGKSDRLHETAEKLVPSLLEDVTLV